MPSIRIESIRLRHVRVPLVEPFIISNGVVAEKDAILIELMAEGVVGIGEASPMAGSFYSYHTPDSCWTALTHTVIPHLASVGCVSLDGTWAHPVMDDPFAVCGVDTALWDLDGRCRGMALWRMLGGDGSREIPSGLAVGIAESIDALLECIDRYLTRDGYRRIKIKVQPGWDIEPIARVRQVFGDVPLMVDANAAYGREHIEHIASWDRFGLMMIEQPLPRDDIDGHAMLAQQCQTPICLDESVESLRQLERIIDREAARIVNIKLQRVGTFAAARAIHDRAAEAGIGCWMGTMPELGVGALAAMHFATLPNIRHPTDVEASDRWFVGDVTLPPVTCRGGLLRLPDGPGLGAALREDPIRRYVLREWSARLGIELREDA